MKKCVVCGGKIPAKRLANAKSRKQKTVTCCDTHQTTLRVARWRKNRPPAPAKAPQSRSKAPTAVLDIKRLLATPLSPKKP